MKKIVTLALIAAVAFSSCEEEIIINATYDDTSYMLEYGSFPPPNATIDDMTVQTVALGRMLFFETKLSSNLTQSCASCHKQENAFSDPNRFSEGAEGDIGNRQAMAIFNMAWHSNGFFWDGRAPELHDQAVLPIQNPVEMNETMPSVIAKLSNEKEYTNQFIRAFGDETINEARIGEALEQFMFTFISNDSKYDRFLAGTATLSASEERGRELFFAEYNPFFPDISGADCAHCHAGINFENDEMFNNGLDTDAEFVDLGLFDETNNMADKAKFKVPSLRNIEVSGPYMHDGRLETLAEVVNHYNANIKLSSTLHPALEATTSTGLMLTAEDKTDLVAFLKTLTDNTYLNNQNFTSPF